MQQKKKHVTGIAAYYINPLVLFGHFRPDFLFLFLI